MHESVWQPVDVWSLAHSFLGEKENTTVLFECEAQNVAACVLLFLGRYEHIPYYVMSLGH